MKKYDKRKGVRKAIDTNNDPYLNMKAPKDMSKCKGCGAIYHDKRWNIYEHVAKITTTKKGTVLCPACKKIKDGYAEGIVNLTGKFLPTHMEDIYNVIKRTEKNSIKKNPLGRIMDMEDIRGGVRISTTTVEFARKLGDAIHKAYKGDIEYKWSDGQKMARINWKRD